MALYTDCNCPVCGKPFGENEDIVVCPVCGMPHHRSCYQSLGHCASEDRHADGFVWEPDPAAFEEQDVAVCPACGSRNQAGQTYCPTCGARMDGKQASRPTVQYTAIPPEAEAELRAYGEEIDGVKTRDLAVFVGINQRYFLPRFAFLSKQNGVSMNWCAMFFHFIYCFFRKMYGLGCAMLALLAVSFGPPLVWMSSFIRSIPMEEFQALSYAALYERVLAEIPQWLLTFSDVMSIVFLGGCVACGLLFNGLYKKHAVTKIKAVAAQKLDAAAHTQALLRQGSVSLKFLIILLFVFMLFNLLSSFLSGSVI